MSEHHAVLLTTHDVDPASHDQLRDLLHEGLRERVQHRPGFIRATLLSDPARRRVVNLAEWRRDADIEATRQDPEVAAYARRAALLGSAQPARFHLVARVEG